ncbi:aspartate aminotransferase [Curtobacterium sp. MCBD17_034]|uniref:MalY/PatB family protein n=1 Tax=unclassified Curtobacterium TaxID=257496 RepID=UPI000DA9258A|nr:MULTISPECIES: aminotransferase class I/II-fold pyridoxal phosphate-dependent enzyme [unclassified Curtobacterium]PZF60433.1 aspartate aminotransferase [Curtobacterium sp. MCBD17_034]PZM35123.1 aspartate aminotransferase [Curtobacterium sp. MCBD17_031]
MSLMISPFDARATRTSGKYTDFPPDVIPMFVAEMDCTLAEPVRDAMIAAVQGGDTGYLGSSRELPDAFADFAERRWGWRVEPDLVHTTTDVSVAAVEVLRQVTEPGDGVVVMPPVYPPFWEFVDEAGCIAVEVPLLPPSDADDDATPFPTTAGWRIDLDGVRRAFADGARTVLLCNPHNPLGLVHSREALAALAALAAEWDAVVVSDEIHAPLVHSDAVFTPFLAASDDAARVGVTVTAASKGWNIAGTKCAMMIGASDRSAAWFDALPREVEWRTSILGYLASTAAYRDGEPWLETLLGELVANRRLLAELLPEVVPGARYRQPQASYLAWLDLRGTPWGDDPATPLVDAARVALGHGPEFGTPGIGHARLNFGCSEETLREALRRIGDATTRAAR